jgi:PKD repeat protein
MRSSSKKKILISTLLILSISIIQLKTVTVKASTIFLNISTNLVYKVGDSAKITGNVTNNGQPIYDALVSVQVNSPYNTPYILRTVQTGQIQNQNWQVNITELYASDAQGNLKDNFTRKETAYIKIKWKNYGSTPAFAVPALYVQYSIGAPCKACFPIGETPHEIPPQTEETLIAAFEIPSTAPYGNTTIYASIYTNTPKEGGYPYCPEKKATFMIITPNPTPPPETQTPPNFNIEFSLSMASPGAYNLYAATSYQGSPVSNTLTFSVQPKTVPPIADFIYSPLTVGVNLSITFDGSPSLPLGYDDVIIKYEWNFGDGTPPVIVNGTYWNPPNPKVTHIFTKNQTVIITLNVTDNEGLWNTTSKTISVNLVIPPTADFTWTPQPPTNGSIVTFDGGISLLGWNGTAKPPIVSYRWDFGDGNIITVTTPIVTHIYQNAQNYTVVLTITDAGGLQSTVSKNVTVYPAPVQGNPDLNGDEKVDMADVNIALDAFGSTPGKPRWNPIADIDKNDRVDMADVLTVLDNFGKYV